MNKEVIIVGGGGHAKVIADIVKLNGDKVIDYLIDNNSEVGKKNCYYFVAIGKPDIREKIMLVDAKWYTAIHPKSIIASDTIIDVGTCVMAGAVINSGSKIGKGVIVNTGATVDHDCVIDDFAHIAPGVNISGTTKVGKRTWIGTGSSVSNNINICDDCMIGVGTVVVKDIIKKGTYVGCPAKLLEN